MQRPNILLIIMDSVRAQNTSLHGYEKDTTPFLKSLTDEAVVYTQAKAPGAKTATSCTSIFTGLHVPQHGLVHRGKTLKSGHTIWETLSEKDYQTAVFTSNVNLTDLPIGLSNEFQEVYSGERQQLPFPSGKDPREYISEDGKINYTSFVRQLITDGYPVQSVINGFSLVMNDKNLSSLLPETWKPTKHDSIYTDLFFDWITSKNEPWAACINLMDAHIPYRPRDEFSMFMNEDDLQSEVIGGSKWDFYTGDRDWQNLDVQERLYDCAIRQVDNEVRKITERLSERDLQDNTLVVITSDHGDAFGEKCSLRDIRYVNHGITGGAGEQIFHVPLLVQWPGNSDNKVVDSAASLTNFPDIVTTALQGETDHGGFTEGDVISYSPAIDPFNRENASDYLSDLSVFDAPIQTLYEDHDQYTRKYMCWEREGIELELSDAMTENISDVKSDTAVCDQVEIAFSALTDHDAVTSTETEIPATVKERLEDLGYA